MGVCALISDLSSHSFGVGLRTGSQGNLDQRLMVGWAEVRTNGELLGLKEYTSQKALLRGTVSGDRQTDRQTVVLRSTSGGVGAAEELGEAGRGLTCFKGLSLGRYTMAHTQGRETTGRPEASECKRSRIKGTVGQGHMSCGGAFAVHHSHGSFCGEEGGGQACRPGL